MLFYMFPLLAHFDWKKRMYFKFSLILGISYLQYTLTMMAVTAMLYIAFAFLPGIVPFSVPVCLVMRLCGWHIKC